MECKIGGFWVGVGGPKLRIGRVGAREQNWRAEEAAAMWVRGGLAVDGGDDGEINILILNEWG